MPAPRQTLAHHAQIGQRKQRVQLRRVLGQAAVAHVHMTEPALDDTERVLHLGSDAGLDALDLFGQCIHGLGPIGAVPSTRSSDGCRPSLTFGSRGRDGRTNQGAEAENRKNIHGTTTMVVWQNRCAIEKPTPLKRQTKMPDISSVEMAGRHLDRVIFSDANWQ